MRTENTLYRVFLNNRNSRFSFIILQFIANFAVTELLLATIISQ